MKFVDYSEAAAAGANPAASWERAKDRLIPGCWPELRPSFSLQQGTKIFTIGSCFARNIEEHLVRLGFDVPMSRFSAPPSEFPARSNGLLNKYTPPSIFQELRWVADIEEAGGCVTPENCEKFCYRLKDGGVIDNGLSGFNPVSYERFIERRAQIFDIVRHAFSAQCVVMTPGLIEAWFDSQREIYIQKAPVSRRLGQFQPQIKFVTLDYATCLGYLQDALDLIRKRNPEAKFLITTSPVPLARTFGGQDVIVANAHAKSLLRAACGELVANNQGVDYFPSYESVMLTRDWQVFESDLQHVSEAFVAKIVARLTETYFAAASQAARDYQASFALNITQGPSGLARSLELARSAHEAEPARHDFALRLARLLMAAGDQSEALRIARRVLESDPRSIEALRILAAIQEDRGEIELAIDAHRQALAVDPDDSHSLAGLAGALIANRDPKAAFAALARALSLHPGCAEAHYQMSVLHRQNGFRAAAERSLRKALDLDPEEPRYIAHKAKDRHEPCAHLASRPRASSPGLAYYASLAKGTVKSAIKSMKRRRRTRGEPTIKTPSFAKE